MDRKDHWQSVYQTKRPDEVSWYQREPTVSLRLIEQVAPDHTARIIDVGAGAGTLIVALAARGYSALTALDVSAAALDEARRQLGQGAGVVTWLDADVLNVNLPAAAFDVWHDRAVFHFLTDPQDRAAYVAQVRRSLAPGGHVVIATFADDGPVRCSGLPVVRYTPDSLQAELGASFRMVHHEHEAHVTPSGASQSFVYCVYALVPAAMVPPAIA